MYVAAKQVPLCFIFQETKMGSLVSIKTQYHNDSERWVQDLTCRYVSNCDQNNKVSSVKQLTQLSIQIALSKVSFQQSGIEKNTGKNRTVSIRHHFFVFLPLNAVNLHQVASCFSPFLSGTD